MGIYIIFLYGGNSVMSLIAGFVIDGLLVQHLTFESLLISYQELDGDGFAGSVQSSLASIFWQFYYLCQRPDSLETRRPCCTVRARKGSMRRVSKLQQ